MLGRKWLWGAFALVVLLACGGGGGGNDAVSPPNDDGGSTDDGGGGGHDGSPMGDDGGTGADAGPGVLDFTCPALTTPAKAATVYVDASATGAESGTMGAPFHTVAAALGAAGSNGVVYVAAGTYKENLDVPDKSLSLYGGFASGFGSRTDACATILQAADAAQPVVAASSTVKSLVLDGFTVQKGARGLSVGGDASVGATFTVTSCVFAQNGKVDDVGGGVFLDRVDATISRSAFRDNLAAKGAAIAHGGDLATITIDTCLFERNIGHSDHGGALYLSPKSGTITRSTFRSNEIGKDTGYGWGGAVIVYKAGAADVKASFSYNVFTDNLASVGGAVFTDDGASVTMSHDLLYRNRSIKENGVARGAALYVDGLNGPGTGSTLVADHLTVVDNVYDETGTKTTSRGGGVYLETYSHATFTNSIFWNAGDDALFGDPTTAITVSYSIAPAGCTGVMTCSIGTGVLQPADVFFVDEAKDDYHEQSTAGHFAKGTWLNDANTSPSIDAADPADSVGAEPAPNGGRANLGVFGGTAEASKSP